MRILSLSVVRVVVASTLVIFMATGCFKKGDGKGKRAFKPSATQGGDIFVPGPGSKPNTPGDPGEGEPAMNPEAKAILAKCFNVPVEEVENVVGWTDPAQAQKEATALCAKLAAVNYNGGSVSDTSEPVTVE